MNIFGMKFAGAVGACLLGLATLGQPGSLMAQENANIHGHVNNAIGQPVTAGEVWLTTEKNPSSPTAKFEYKFPLDAGGNYKGAVKSGTYMAGVFQQGHGVDYMPAVIASGEDKAVDFDMTRKEYMDKLSPAEKEQIEEFKKKNEAAVAANATADKLNALLKSARADNLAGNYDSAVKSMTDATTAKPTEALLWDVLGDAQLGLANAAAKAARDSKTADPTVADKYAAAEASYQKALDLNSKLAKPSADLVAVVNNQLGVAYGRTGKTKEAQGAYEAAATSDPTKAGMYYFNEAATLFNANDTAGAAAAADKAITADPTKPEAYYIKAEGLAPNITGPGADGKFIAPPGLVDACNKYLELAPTGPHAQDMKDLLGGLGEKVQTTYKAPGKK